MTVVCELCDASAGDILVSTEQLRVILVDDINYPGFCRVIWNAHVKEMTDLSDSDKNTFMQAVWKVEAAIRAVMQPHKMNVASLGNMVPHLHWHLIPRYTDDAHFPNPIWAAARSDKQDQFGLDIRRARIPQLQQTIISNFSS